MQMNNDFRDPSPVVRRGGKAKTAADNFASPAPKTFITPVYENIDDVTPSDRGEPHRMCVFHPSDLAAVNSKHPDSSSWSNSPNAVDTLDLSSKDDSGKTEKGVICEMEPVSNKPEHVLEEKLCEMEPVSNKPEHVPEEKLCETETVGNKPEHVPEEKLCEMELVSNKPKYAPEEKLCETETVGNKPEHMPEEKLCETEPVGNKPEHALEEKICETEPVSNKPEHALEEKKRKRVDEPPPPASPKLAERVNIDGKRALRAHFREVKKLADVEWEEVQEALLFGNEYCDAVTEKDIIDKALEFFDL